jgi:hypothetical protein
VAVDSAGNVADSGNNRVLKLAPEPGAPQMVGSPASKARPGAVDFAANVNVADYGHNRVVKLSTG